MKKLFCLTVFALISAALIASAQTRPPAVAGSFYPDKPEVLTKQVEQFLAAAAPSQIASTSSRVVGLIVPHAGYVFSGATAATGFKAVAGQPFDRIIFLGVDHHSGQPTISVHLDGGFDTPVGPVPVDASGSAELLAVGPPLVNDPGQHRQEHSLEVLMPFFLKTVGARPAQFISVGGPPENGFFLGKTLTRILTGFPGRILLIASTDWSHYHDSGTAKKLDDSGLAHTLKLDAPGLLEACRRGETELCGLNGVIALLTVMKAAGASSVQLAQTDSSQAFGDTSRVVGYAAVLFEASGMPPVSTSASTPIPASATVPVVPSSGSRQLIDKEKPMLKDYQKEALAMVRKTLESVLAGGAIPEFPDAHPKFQEKCGVFVTLKKHGELRGCIGFIEGREALGKAIPRMAMAAALEDSRFPQCRSEELKDIDIEVSILSPMIPVTGIQEIEVGRDGLLLRKGYNSGLLLPQVPTEYGWDKETYLHHLCLKADLPPGSFNSPDAKLMRFTAEVFGEHE